MPHIKSKIKMTSNSKQNRQKTQQELQKPNFQKNR